VPTWLAPLAVQGGAVSVLGLLAWRLVLTLIRQTNASADRAWRAVEAADRRADESVRLLGEVLSALRAVEALVRTSHRDRDAA
jgi:hypothetical protein